jgi:hypothetical protein
MSDEAQRSAQLSAQKAKPAPGEAAFPVEPLRPEEFYMDGPYLVFTAAYHLRRGYCCNSDCRHCPYKGA